MSSDAPKTRRRIVEATLDLLEGGDTQVSMSDIAARAGITRQALYLHFATRADLLIAATHLVDERNHSEDRLRPSRTAKTGRERLDAYVRAWAAYVPEIHGTAKALLAMKDSDEAADKAWTLRMQDMKEGCAAAIRALKNDGDLAPGYTVKRATDLLWTMLSVRNWELLTVECGWSQAEYVQHLVVAARRLFVADGSQ